MLHASQIFLLMSSPSDEESATGSIDVRRDPSTSSYHSFLGLLFRLGLVGLIAGTVAFFTACERHDAESTSGSHPKPLPTATVSPTP